MSVDHPVDSLSIIPSSATVRANGRLRLVARGGGVEQGPADVTWGTSNPSVAVVDDSGFVHGIDEGSATIRASMGGQGASAAIRVTPSGSRIDPSTGEDGRRGGAPADIDESRSGNDVGPREAPAANATAALPRTREPVGYTEITNRFFRARDDAGWRFNPSDHFSIVEDSSAPSGCCSVGRASYPRGRTGGTSPVVSWYDFSSEGFTELYVSFWLRLSDNWQGHRSGVNKIGFVWIHKNPAVYFSAQGAGGAPLQPQIRLQNVPGTTRNLTPNRNRRVVERGEWHHWEVQIVSNSDGRPNGIARLWLDGVPVAEYGDVAFAGPGQRRSWESVYWYPIWGGVGDAVRSGMHMDIDHFYASGR